jgi:hypothetical protein
MAVDRIPSVRTCIMHVSGNFTAPPPPNFPPIPGVPLPPSPNPPPSPPHPEMVKVVKKKRESWVREIPNSQIEATVYHLPVLVKRRTI